MSDNTTNRQSRRSRKPLHNRAHEEPALDSTQEQLILFMIGLRLLGEKKAQEFLAYMAALQASETREDREE